MSELHTTSIVVNLLIQLVDDKYSNKLMSEFQSIWYSPSFMLKASYNALNSPGKKSNLLLKKISEVLPVIIVCAGLSSESGIPHWMQIVPETESPPDIKIVTILKGKNGNIIKYLDVEVVELEKHSEATNSIDVAKFIIEKKLTPPKSTYDEKTAILCYLNRKANTTFQEIRSVISETDKQNPVYIIGCDRKDKLYHFCQVNPEMNTYIKVDLSKPFISQEDVIMTLREGSKQFKPGTLAPDPFKDF